MNFSTAAPRRDPGSAPGLRPGLARISLVAGICLALCGCAGANPTGEFLARSGLGPTTAPRADFVEKTRPQSLDYMPIGTAVAGRPTPARTPAEVKAAEAELDAVRARNQASGAAAASLGGTPPPPAIPVKTP